MLAGGQWASVRAAPVFSTQGGAGVVTDVFDVGQGTRVIASTPQHNAAGNSDPRSAFGLGQNPPWVEPGNAMFADGAATGTVDAIEWQTSGPIRLDRIELRLAQDGAASAQRAAREFTLSASSDGIQFHVISGGPIPSGTGGKCQRAVADHRRVSAGLPWTTCARSGSNSTRATTSGPRVIEVDGFGSPVEWSGTFLDRLAFNAATNSLTGRGAAARDDEGPGLATGFTSSSRVNGNDTIQDAFGNKNGAVEPESFIFGDGGTRDNGDQIIGNGGETVDFITWRTTQAITVAGYQVRLSGDGGSSQRDTELVRFLVEGEVVDAFDNDGFDGTRTRQLPDGAVTGDDFRIEFTRTSSAGGRIFDVDAITAMPVAHEGGVVLNEVCAENHGTLRDDDGDTPDWVELFNNGDLAVDLGGWGLSDDPAVPMKWVFPPTPLAGRRHFLVFLSDKDRSLAGQPLHTNFQLKADGELLFLTRSNGQLADEAPAVRLRADVSVGRSPNGTGTWKFFTEPTPARSNSFGQAWSSLLFEPPVFSLPGGYYDTSQSLTLTTDEPRGRHPLHAGWLGANRSFARLSSPPRTGHAGRPA